MTRAYQQTGKAFFRDDADVYLHFALTLSDELVFFSVIILFLLTLVASAAVFCFITFTNKFNEGIVEVGSRQFIATHE